MKRAFIIHGWDGVPDLEKGILPWVYGELEKRGFTVVMPEMPEPLEPRIDEWVSFLGEQVGMPDEDTYLIGHSIGAQTVIRYLASLPEGNRVGGAVLLAGWLNLTDAAYEDEDDREIGRPWRETPIDWERAKGNARRFVAIFSDDDPVVPLSNQEIFREKLGADIVVEHGMEHFSAGAGVTELPSLLRAVLDMSEARP